MDPSETFLDALGAALRRAAECDPAQMAPPVAVLWPDGARRWSALLPMLRQTLPVLTLGNYAPEEKTGPAIWLRCMVERALPEADWPSDEMTVLYLPGLSGQALSGLKELPDVLQPLAELQFRGAVWSGERGRDWSIVDFLNHGLGIPTREDAATATEAERALVKLAAVPLADLRARAPLDKAYFTNLILGADPLRDLLLWLNDPQASRAARAPEEWAAFCDTCRATFRFDPDTDGVLTAAAKLGARDGEWDRAWRRFAEAPHHYKNVTALLEKARPPGSGGLFFQESSWPQDNADGETALRHALLALHAATPTEAHRAVTVLEAAHGRRRGWVWSTLGRSPLAGVLPHLLTLAEAAQNTLPGATPEAMAASYSEGGWKADASVLDALAGADTEDDLAAVRAAVRSLYLPWLQNAATAFQKAMDLHPPAVPSKTALPPKAGTCLLFVDGLRYDVAERLATVLEEDGMAVERGRRFGPLPGVTPTAKPAVSPAVPLLGPFTGFDVTAEGKAVKLPAAALRAAITDCGWAAFDAEEKGDPDGSGWTEHGRFDPLGHDDPKRLPHNIAGQVRSLAARIRSLLNAGWKEVKLLTDHGWLLLPGGLPKAELPEHLTEERKGRCARLKPGSSTESQTVPWFWDAEVRIAVAPGIGCYVANREYEHGGLSVQESVLPAFTVRPAATAASVSIENVTWKQLRCRVTLSSGGSGYLVDLRAKPADPSSSLIEPRPVKEDGQASFAVEDDYNGQSAAIVVTNAAGKILAQMPTIIGGDVQGPAP